MSQAEVTGRKPLGRARLLLTVSALVVVGLAGGAAGGLMIHGQAVERRATALAPELDAAIQAHRAYRWERPVLRGEPRDCNALTASLGLPAPWAKPPVLAGVLEGKEAVADPLRELIAHHQSRLDELLAATQCSHSSSSALVGLNEVRPLDDNLATHRAWTELLIVRARSQPPSACLRESLDILRRAQDLVPGGRLQRLADSYVEINVTIAVTGHCARHSPRADVEEAAREMMILAGHPPPSGGAFAAETLDAARIDFLMFLTLEKTASWRLFSVATRSWPLDRTEAGLHFARELGALSPRRYPADIDRGRTMLSSPANASMFTTVVYADRLNQDGAAQAALRLTALWTTILARAQADGSLPESINDIAGHPSLADPFAGAPLRWRREPDGSSGKLWSVGANRIDEQAGGDDLRVEVLPPGGA